MCAGCVDNNLGVMYGRSKVENMNTVLLVVKILLSLFASAGI